MYLEHFGLNEAPFRITPHTDFFFAGADRGATLDALVYAITHDEGIVKVSGEVGSGKTMLCRMLMERLPTQVVTIYIANPLLTREEMLHTIVAELGLDTGHEPTTMMIRRLVEHLVDLYAARRQVVVLVDEAHAMPAETLEQIRLLSNLESKRHKLMQIVLFGQPELTDVLARPEMRQLKDRITHHFELAPLGRDDVTAYIEFRMRAAGYRGPSVFEAAAIRLIASASGGLTRRINVIADKALLSAYAGGRHAVNTRDVQVAIRDARIKRPRRKGLWAAAALAVLAGLGLALWWALPGSAWFAAEAPGSADTARAAGAMVARAPDGANLASAQTATAPAAAPAAPPAPTPPPAAMPPALPPAAPMPPQAPAAGQTAAAADPLAAAGEVAISAAAGSPQALTLSGPVDPRIGPLALARLAQTRQWLPGAPGERWFVQLLTTDATQAAHLEGFLAQASRLANTAETRVYLADVGGQQRIGVIYGEYASLEQALAAAEAMPAALKAYRPHARQVERLRRP
jgi:type II secretory pathway predicted ATPase ExeA/septal ring-binding cell division protein DamX